MSVSLFPSRDLIKKAGIVSIAIPAFLSVKILLHNFNVFDELPTGIDDSMNRFCLNLRGSWEFID